MKRTLLNRALYDGNGQMTASPGTSLNSRNFNGSESTIRRYIKKGWLEDRGRIVITKKGILEA